MIKFVDCICPDSNSGGLERGVVQWDGQDFILGGALLHIPHDLRELCPLQPPRRHLGRGLLY